MKDKAKALLSETLYRNSLYLMLTTGTMAVFGFVFWLVVAHLYRPTEVGLAATIISAMNFIANLSLLGLNSTFMRFLPRSTRRNEQIDTSLIIVAVAGSIAGLGFCLAAPYFAPRLVLLHDVTYGVGFTLICLAATVNLITDSVFIAYRAAGYNLLVDGFIGSSVQLVLPFVLIGLGTYGIFASQGLAAVAAMSASLFFLIKRFSYRPRLKFEWSVVRHLRYFSMRSYIAGLFAMAPTIILPIIILNHLGAASAGYYYLAFMMANVLFSISYAVAQSLFAEGSYGDQELYLLVRRAAMFLGALIIPASILLALIGPFVLDIFGRSYGNHGREVVIVLAAAGPFMAAFSLGNVVLSIRKRMRALILVNLACSAIVCGLALLWIKHGLTGVAAAWVVGHAVTSVVIFVLLGWYRRPAASVRTPA